MKRIRLAQSCFLNNNAYSTSKHLVRIVVAKHSTTVVIVVAKHPTIVVVIVSKHTTNVIVVISKQGTPRVSEHASTKDGQTRKMQSHAF